MTFEEYKISLNHNVPPKDLNPSLMALWYDAKGNWNQAHLLVQETNDYSEAWVHGYLHRKEGDTANASYWYSRAGKQMPMISLKDEWQDIAKKLIKTEMKNK
jgi:hypothetical protein